MYAYIDETGNTGAHLFDPNQPIFMSGTMICRTNFDLLHKNQIRALANEVGESYLHANAIGKESIRAVAPKLYKLLKKINVGFHFARVKKCDLAVIKLVDTLFDSGENLAVPWHAYNFRPLRYLLVFKVASLMDEELTKAFWAVLMERNQRKATENLGPVLRTLLERVPNLPDSGSRERVSQALDWAIENPEAIHHYSRTKADQYGHLPNMVVFPEVLRGIENKSQIWNESVIEIKHDRQSQFQETLKEWHEIASTASMEAIEWTLNEKYVLGSVAGSKFSISSSDQSPGLQVIDIVLWLVTRLLDHQPIPSECRNLLDLVLRRSGYYEYSLEALENYLEEFIPKLYSRPISPEQAEQARSALSLAEERRQQNMRKYAQKKLGLTADESN